MCHRNKPHNHHFLKCFSCRGAIIFDVGHISVCLVFSNWDAEMLNLHKFLQWFSHLILLVFFPSFLVFKVMIIWVLFYIWHTDCLKYNVENCLFSEQYSSLAYVEALGAFAYLGILRSCSHILLFLLLLWHIVVRICLQVLTCSFIN